MAAASVTRATSSTRTRSSPPMLSWPWMLSCIAPSRSRCSASARALRASTAARCGSSAASRTPGHPCRWPSSAARMASSVVSCVMRITGGRRAELRAGVDAGLRAARAALHDALQRHLALAHAAGDAGHGARPVVEPRGARSRRPGAGRAWRACRASSLAAGTPNGGGLSPRAMSTMSLATADAVALRAGAGTGQQQVAGEVAVDGDAVGDAGDLGDGRVLGHHGRMHALLDAALGHQRHAEQLDAVAEIVGRLDVGLA